MTQADLALRGATSQAAISNYESGRKRPSIETLSRLLGAAGFEIRAQPKALRARVPTEAEFAESARSLAAVLALAEALPTRHSSELRFPRLEQHRGARR